MKRTLLAATSALLLSATAPATLVASQGTASASRQSLQVLDVSDHCIDEFDEDLIIYVNEGDKDCKVTVRVKGRGAVKSKVVLEYFDEEDGWVRDSDYKPRITTSAGRTTFLIGADFPRDPNADCYEGDSYSHRFAVATSGRFRAFRSESFEIVYTSADDNPACTGDGSDDDYWDE